MLKEISRDEVPFRRRGRYGYTVDTLREFWESGSEAAIVDFPDKTPVSVYASLVKARARMNLPVDVVTRKKKVYLIRREAD